MNENILPDLKKAAKRSKESNRFDFNIEDKYLDLGKNKKYYIKTHGCQANQRDSETMAGILEMMSYLPSDNSEDADIVIINTCAVRQTAEEKVYGEIGALKKIKRERPEMIIGIGGCMAQEEDSVKTIREKYPQVDIIFGTHNIYSLPKLIKNVLDNQKRYVEVLSDSNLISENMPVTRFESHKAWVNIMYGCDKFCTYCIVPFTRGKERSRKKEDIIQEVLELKNEGYKEVCLLGQNVNAYGNDLYDDYGFGQLLDEVAKTNIPRIRFVTSHPWNFNDRMIKAMKDNANIMPYLHLPLQAGNDEILKKMNRRYTSEEYINLFDKLKKELPHYSFTTDIIVGFPNESEEAFLDTLRVVEHCKYDNAFTFIYSPRIGTPAAKMEDNISIDEKHDRLKRLNERVSYYANQSNQRFKDKIVEVLVDGPSKRDSNVYAGYTPENKLVNFTGDNINIGDLVKVKITEVKSFSLNGELVK